MVRVYCLGLGPGADVDDGGFRVRSRCAGDKCPSFAGVGAPTGSSNWPILAPGDTGGIVTACPTGAMSPAPSAPPLRSFPSI